MGRHPTGAVQVKYVYTTARGKLCAVEADTPQDAWKKARRKHSVRLLLDQTDAAWAGTSDGRCIRETGGDVPAGHVSKLLEDIP